MTGRRRRPTARDVKLVWLGALADDATDVLAFAALDAIEERDALRAALVRAIAMLRDQDAKIDALRGAA